MPMPLCAEKSQGNSAASRPPLRGLRVTICSALNKPFASWSEVFPNAACVVSLVDRFVHHAEIVSLEGDSYRLKEARERAEQQTRKRKSKR